VRELHWLHEYDIKAVCIQGCATGSTICMDLPEIELMDPGPKRIQNVDTSRSKQLQKLLLKHFSFFAKRTLPDVNHDAVIKDDF
jgi:hypothetical protein